MAWNNLGCALYCLKQYETAADCFSKVLELNPDSDILGDLLHARMKICDWGSFDNMVSQLSKNIQLGKVALAPFPVLNLTTSLKIQQKAAEIYAAANYPPQSELGPIHKHSLHNKIRIGYYSADYHNHATTYLMAELFERHDKDKFELVGISFGPDKCDKMRKRVAAVFDQFIDVRDKSDKEVAQMSRDLGIDIAVDLKGYTEDCRPGVFSYRAAPIQVSYLGYPGTMGVGYIDYLIADRTLVTPESQPYYSEKVAFLPNCYQVNDAKRQISDRVFTREELGLPVKGFVFCCFNNNYKITPKTFDSWMRILKQVENSVLWLFEDNSVAANNLRKEADLRGIDADRLVFAKRMPLDEHLARHRAADLFIDTLPYNAHTTASDALWAGLPVLTCVGEAFSSWVAASLLNAVGLPELITATQDEYEALAVELASDFERLSLIKIKLEQNRMTTPLFDTRLFVKHIEAAYTVMHERYQADLPPDHICIDQ